MERKRADIERIRRYFDLDNNADFKYIRKIFTDQEYEDELEPLLKKEWFELLKEENNGDKNLDHILYKLNYDIINTKSEPRIYSHRAFIWFSRIAAVLILPPPRNNLIPITNPKKKLPMNESKKQESVRPLSCSNVKLLYK